MVDDNKQNLNNVGEDDVDVEIVGLNEDERVRRERMAALQAIEELRKKLEEEEEEFKVRGIMLAIIKRQADIVARYADFRIQDMLERGIIIDYSVKRVFKPDGMRLIIDFHVPEFMFEYVRRRRQEYFRRRDMILREARKDDRYKYRFSDAPTEYETE